MERKQLFYILQWRAIFQLKISCVPTELVAFQNRIGGPGLELILQESIRVNDSQKTIMKE